jgi:peptide chain release factor 2
MEAGAGGVPCLVVTLDVPAELKELSGTLSSIEAVLDLDALRREAAELEQQAGRADLWNDPEVAQRVTRRLSHLQGDVRRVEDLRRRLDDVGVLHGLAEDEDDAGTRTEVDAEFASLRRAIDELEIRTLLSGEYDERDALITIQSEAGGVDAADWAQMLLRMYLRWAERHGHPTDVYDTSYAEEAGIKSATFVVKAPYAYGTLAGEHGTHRLVRISPFDNQHRRQTSFAGVDVVPVVEASDHVEIDEKDIRVDVYRSSGPGGQGVNTTDSAVRITHLPTGIVVSCQNERSQLQNKATAMAVLQAKLLERRRHEERAQLDALRGDAGGSWGNQIRSYVLHPYQMVKDLRTEVETGNTAAVLDGDIDQFVEAEIRWKRQQEAGR